MNSGTATTTHTCHTTATVLEGSWKPWDAFCSGSTPGPATSHPFPLLGGPRSQLSMASLHRVSQDKGLSQASHPHAAVSKATIRELGNRPWLSDRGCPACPRTELALIPQCHERTDCSVTDHERMERRPCTARSLEHRPSVIVHGLPGLKNGVNEDPVWISRQTLTS